MDQTQLRSVSRHKGEHFASKSWHLSSTAPQACGSWLQRKLPLIPTLPRYAKAVHVLQQSNISQQKTTVLLILVKHTMIILVWDVLPGCTWPDARTCMELRS